MFPIVFTIQWTVLPRRLINGSTGPTYFIVKRRPITPVFWRREVPSAVGGRWLWYARRRSQSPEMRNAARERMSGVRSDSASVFSWFWKLTVDSTQPVNEIAVRRAKIQKPHLLPSFHVISPATCVFFLTGTSTQMPYGSFHLSPVSRPQASLSCWCPERARK